MSDKPNVIVMARCNETGQTCARCLRPENGTYWIAMFPSGELKPICSQCAKESAAPGQQDTLKQMDRIAKKNLPKVRVI